MRTKTKRASSGFYNIILVVSNGTVEDVNNNVSYCFEPIGGFLDE